MRPLSILAFLAPVAFCLTQARADDSPPASDVLSTGAAAPSAATVDLPEAETGAELDADSAYADRETPVEFGLVVGYSGSRARLGKGEESAGMKPVGSAIGAIFQNLALSEELSVELDLVYLQRELNHEISSWGSTGESRLSHASIAAQFGPRIALGRYASVGAGPYLAYGVGHVTLTDSAANHIDRSYTQAELARLDFGLTASVRGKLPLDSQLSLIGEARYQQGMKDLSTNPDITANVSDAQFLFGLTLGI